MKKIKAFAVLGLVGILFLMFSSQIKAQVKIDTLQGHIDNLQLAEESTKTKTEDVEKLQYKVAYAFGVAALGNIGPEVTAMDLQNLPVQMRRGLLGMAEDQVVAMFNSQPRIDVVAHLAEEWVPGYNGSQSAYASGYSDLVKSGITSLWSFTRNIAYLGFVVIMILIGFMIMFRNKIGGQTLVTIGNTLPRVVVSLVLVTFSFAIAGILIDICGVLMSVISSSSGLGSNVPIDNVLTLIKESLGFSTISALGLGLLPGIIVGAVAGGGIGGVIAGSLVIVILALVIIGIVVVGAIKLWFALIKSYLSLLINVVISPIAIMMGALPGNDASTVNIFKSIFRNALVFPVAFAIVNLPYFIEKQAGVEVGLPQTLTGNTGGATNVGYVILAVAKIIAIYAAAQAPAMVLAIIPSTASKSGADAAGAIKAGLGKMPFIGGMFGSK